MKNLGVLGRSSYWGCCVFFSLVLFSCNRSNGVGDGMDFTTLSQQLAVVQEAVVQRSNQIQVQGRALTPEELAFLEEARTYLEAVSHWVDAPKAAKYAKRRALWEQGQQLLVAGEALLR